MTKQVPARFSSPSARVSLVAAAVTMLASTLVIGCSTDDSWGTSDGDPSGKSVCYRGRKVFAERDGDSLVVEGDILIDESDESCDRAGSGDTETVRLALLGTPNFWPNGIIPFEFAPGATLADQNAILTAMNEWEAHVPGIDFRPAVAGDGARRLRLVASYPPPPEKGPCNSTLGQGYPAVINFESTCAQTHRMHHELGHALGLDHQQNRKDRDQFVTVNWSNIKGCTSSGQCGFDACNGNLADCGCTEADVLSDKCYLYDNFRMYNRGGSIGSYDYDSVMHYGPLDASKNKAAGLITITPVDPLVSIGQRDHLSQGDIAAARVLYPVLDVHDVIFVVPGRASTVCELRGREKDAATMFWVNGSSENSNQKLLVTPGRTVTHLSCQTISRFWSGLYDYPNSDPLAPGSPTEEFYSETDTVLLSAGLIPVLF